MGTLFLGAAALLAVAESADATVQPPSETLARPHPIIAPGEVPYDATVVEEHSLVYETPTLSGKVLRRVFVGEMLHVIAEIEGDDGRRWSLVSLGTEQSGYIETTRLGRSDRLPRTSGRAARVLREERPLAITTRAFGEGLGPTIAVRYHPFSRIGLTGGYAVPVAGGGDVGWEAGTQGNLRAARIFNVGLISCLVLDDLSPVMEIGIGSLAVSEGDATLSMTTAYLSLGLEWMLSSGVFFGAGVAYVRSTSINVSFAFDDVADTTLAVPDFGAFDPGPNNLFQAVSPSLTLGYAF